MKKFFCIGILIFIVFLALQGKSLDPEENRELAACVKKESSIQDAISQKFIQSPSITSELDLSLEFVRKKWNIRDYHEIDSNVFKSPLGQTIVYSFKQGAIPILGMEIRIRMDRERRVLEEESTYSPIPELKMDEKLVEHQLTDLARQIKERFQIEEISSDSLVIFKRPALSEGELAVSTAARESFRGGQVLQVLLRLEDGKLLMKAQGRSEFGS